ncbi:MAG: ABC transporter family substrate-binding protein [Sciscionella sp.]|nr:ABC transporter family substrate-binding protein [Sciscionella sp.]
MNVRGGRLVVVLAAAAFAIAGCTITPPPPLVNGTGASTPATPVGDRNQIVVGVDGVAGGYNPHKIADQSTVTMALASLMLPSVFRPAANGTPQLDPTVMTSASVTNTSPFTVTYRVRTDASWSDGVPIAAEDFVYLRDQLSSQPGAADGAGYRLISGITARDNGKLVEVSFAKPYPGWQSLFADLLPAHLLKDAPGGWSAALSDSYPAYGGPYAVKSIDPDRGEIDLERNDRYWATPSIADEIVLRKADPKSVANALRIGDDQLASIAATDKAVTALRKPGASVRLTDVPRPTVVQLLLRPASPRLADIRVRTAVADAIDRDALITAGSGRSGTGDAGKPSRADALVLAPSQAGYTSTMPGSAPGVKPDPAGVRANLTAAGYTKTSTGWALGGKPLKLVIAAPAGDEPYVSLAKAVQRQLASAGIAASVITPNADKLFDQQLKGPDTPGGVEPASPDTVDIVLGPRPLTTDAASTLATEFGCQPIDAGGSTGSTGATGSIGSSGSPSSSGSASASGTPGTSTANKVPANPAGFCYQPVQQTITAAITGRTPLPSALAEIEPQLWRQVVVLPLFQLTDEVAIRTDLAGAKPTPPLYGPFVNAVSWKRTGK